MLSIIKISDAVLSTVRAVDPEQNVSCLPVLIPSYYLDTVVVPVYRKEFNGMALYTAGINGNGYLKPRLVTQGLPILN